MVNIAEILKNVPNGTKLYSPICGECELKGVMDGGLVKVYSNRYFYTFDKNGKYHTDALNGECLLFPSKDNRDWETFKIKPEFKKGDFVVSEYGTIAILDNINDGGGITHISTRRIDNYRTLDTTETIHMKDLRYATDEEKTILLNLISSNKKNKFNIGDKVVSLNGGIIFTIDETTDEGYWCREDERHFIGFTAENEYQLYKGEL